ncbi:MAG: hypothetical protein ACOY5Y_07115 [Pseudomonadota bacterium]
MPSRADDESLLAMDAARMSTASIAMTMGWSARRVADRLAKLKAEAEAHVEAPAVSAPPPAPALSQPSPSPAAPGGEDFAERADFTFRGVDMGLGPDRGVLAQRDPETGVFEIVKATETRRAPSPYDTAHPRPPPVPIRRGRVEPVKRLRAVTPAVRRYAGWFLAAGWPAAEVAELFDVAPEAIAANGSGPVGARPSGQMGDHHASGSGPSEGGPAERQGWTP